MARYLVLLAFCIVGLLSLAAGFNVLVNPYAWFETQAIPSVNEVPLGLNHRLPLARALAIDRLRPAALILGNSRAEAGYDPEHWPGAERPAYNGAIGGAGIRMLGRYLGEASNAGRLREVLLAVDFSMFDPAMLDQGVEEEALMSDADGHSRNAWHAMKRAAAALVSGTALSDSWWSLTHQRRPVARYMPSGLRNDAADIDQVVREGGHHEAALNAESSFLAASLRDLESPAARSGYRHSLEELDSMLSAARRQNVRVTLVINPIHARQNYAVLAAGLWPAFEQWKRDLADIATKTGATAWDFSGVSRCTSEPLPGRGDSTTRMRWYRETSHFRTSLGDKVLARVYAGREDSECPGFGVELRPQTVGSILADQQQRLLNWATNYPADAREVSELAARYGRGNRALQKTTGGP